MIEYDVYMRTWVTLSTSKLPQYPNRRGRSGDAGVADACRNADTSISLLLAPNVRAMKSSVCGAYKLLRRAHASVWLCTIDEMHSQYTDI
eukprot:4322704-Pleurochrysis_carterae.AAC.4